MIDDDEQKKICSCCPGGILMFSDELKDKLVLCRYKKNNILHPELIKHFKIPLDYLIM